MSLINKKIRNNKIIRKNNFKIIYYNINPNEKKINFNDNAILNSILNNINTNYEINFMKYIDKLLMILKNYNLEEYIKNDNNFKIFLNILKKKLITENCNEKLNKILETFWIISFNYNIEFDEVLRNKILEIINLKNDDKLILDLIMKLFVNLFKNKNVIKNFYEIKDIKEAVQIFFRIIDDGNKLYFLDLINIINISYNFEENWIEFFFILSNDLFLNYGIDNVNYVNIIFKLISNENIKVQFIIKYLIKNLDKIYVFNENKLKNKLILQEIWLFKKIINVCKFNNLKEIMKIDYIFYFNNLLLNTNYIWNEDIIEEYIILLYIIFNNINDLNNEFLENIINVYFIILESINYSDKTKEFSLQYIFEFINNYIEFFIGDDLIEQKIDILLKLSLGTKNFKIIQIIFQILIVLITNDYSDYIKTNNYFLDLIQNKEEVTKNSLLINYSEEIIDLLSKD